MPNEQNRFTLFTLFSNGDIEKEKRMWLQFLQIIYYIWLSIIPIGVLVITTLLRHIDLASNSKLGTKTNISISFYLATILLLLLGYFWRNIIKDHYFYRGFLGIVFSRYFRTVCFEVGVGLAFLLSLCNVSWFAIAPLLIIEGIALILTFPTRKKWDKWLANIEVSK
jgi:hypothetical protein